jgi:glutamine amidotransferase
LGKLLQQTVYVLNFGGSNLTSLCNALEYLETKPLVVNHGSQVPKSGKVFIPGVGSFASAIDRFTSRGFREPILEGVQTRNISIFGICLGMQLLGQSSTEHGESLGLGVIGGRLSKFTKESSKLVQNVGFDSVTWNKDTLLSKGVPDTACFYFTHSYRFAPGDVPEAVGISENGEKFVSAVDNGINIFGTQFHPEKSQKFGLQILKNFLNA